jgi:type IV pilus assembly protein PilB
MDETKASKPQSRPIERHCVQMGEQLVRRGALTAQQLQEALAQRTARFEGKDLGEVLVELGMVNRAAVMAARAHIYGIPFATISARMIRPGALGALPREFCAQSNVIPLTCVDDWITVAVADFTNIFLSEQIKKLSGKQVQLVAAEPENIRQVREELYRENTATTSDALSVDGELSGLRQLGLEELTLISSDANIQEVAAAELEAAAAGSPTIRLVDHVIRAAVDVGASDIHIEPDSANFGIRYRIDGELTAEALRPSIRLLPAVVSRIKIMAGLDISERRMPQDGNITIAVGGKPIELRVSTMATTYGEKVVIRVVDNRGGVRKLEELGFSPDMLSGFRRCINLPNGIVLVTGPTGSGKSTTLYAALSEMVTPKVNISSIEDPVEYHLKGVNQFQANAKTGFTFAKALRSMLRQDPDIIMVGEIRDTETAQLATEAALTGHLVLSTLHTNDAPGAIPRLMNMGVEPYLVAASLRGVLAQRLVKRLCSHCRRRIPMPPALRQLIVDLGGTCAFDTIYQGAGCDCCRGTGFRGRVGVYELMHADEDMLQDLSKSPALQVLRQRAIERGLISLMADTLDKLGKGIVGVEAIHDVMGHVDREDEMQCSQAATAA